VSGGRSPGDRARARFSLVEERGEPMGAIREAVVVGKWAVEVEVRWAVD